ncbi:MAG: glucose/arabinose dehydrogenase [Saprospiraceae bacterium]|jgi:glucose/arabinose dehydrogenase
MEGLQDPASFAFSPDGRLFYGERITGRLVVGKWDAATKLYLSEDNPFYEFGDPAERHRSSGLRGFTFDPNYGENGFIYAFYMRDIPRHNQVVTIQVNPSDEDVEIGGETVLMELPFSSSNSSGSHNGGFFGTDQKLYFTTGDG